VSDGSECSLSKFVDGIKLQAAVRVLEGSAAVQGHLGRRRKWADRSLTKLSESKCKILPMGWNNPV